MSTKHIAVIGNPASGKSAFIQTCKENPLSKRYHKTIAFEVHPMGHYNGHFLNLCEFGHYCDWEQLKNMDGIIYISTTNVFDFKKSDKPYVTVINRNRSAKFDTEKILNEIASKI